MSKTDSQHPQQFTALHALHQQSQAKLVDFAGWDMPIHYGSQLDEHHAVRQAVGVFDVSHMLNVEMRGDKAKDALSYLLANDVAKLTDTGRALYSAMLNEQGGIIDDLIVYYIADDHYRMVLNAATARDDIDYMNDVLASYDVTITALDHLSMLALQGPQADAAMQMQSVLPAALVTSAIALKPFNSVADGDVMLAKTGYTGESGYEIMLPHAQAQSLWQDLLANDVSPVGLGARDTLRLEAGMNLYGQDMDVDHTPYESAIGWTLSVDDSRDFIGKSALVQQKSAGVPMRLVGLVLEDKGVLRAGMTVNTDAGEGVITSGSFSPSMQKSIALARIPYAVTEGHVSVNVRNKQLQAKLVKLPFVRQGKILCE